MEGIILVLIKEECMNIRIKSLLAGLAGAVCVYFLANNSSKTRPAIYTGRLSVMVQPDSSNRSFSFSDIKKLTERRIEAAGFRCIVEEKNGLADITIFKLDDTLLPASLLSKNIHVQFRELYTLNEPVIISMLTAPSLNIGQETPVDPNRIEEKVVPDTSLMDLMNKEQQAKSVPSVPATKNRLTDILRINSSSMPDNRGIPQFSAEIGQVNITDTALLRSMLNQKDVISRTPADLELHYGTFADKQSRDLKLNLYFIRTNGSPEKAIIENGDVAIAEAALGYQKRPEITIQFTPNGSAKWEELTKRCVDKYLALIIDNEVITAPRVISPIPGGSTTLTGSYTMSEAKSMAKGIQIPRLPFKLHVQKQSFTKDQKPFDFSRSLLLPLLGFLICASLGFYLFKTLKTT